MSTYDDAITMYQALNIVLDRMSFEIHKSYMSKIIRDIKTLRILKSFSYDDNHLSVEMMSTVDKILEYTLYKLIIIDPLCI